MFLHRSSQNYRVIMKENVEFLYRCVKLDIHPFNHCVIIILINLTDIF